MFALEASNIGKENLSPTQI